MKLHLIAAMVLIGMLLSCSTGKMKSYEENRNCLTTIEGRYLTGQVWTGKTPALFIKENARTVVKYGTIIDITDDEVHFDPLREGPLYDPEPYFIERDLILGLIDSIGQVRLGHIPPEFSTGISTEMHLARVGQSDPELIKLWMRPGPAFSYCIEGGVYQVVEIFFHDRQGNIDRAETLPTLELKIHPGHANYLGDVSLNAHLQNPELSLELNYVIQYRASQASTAGLVGGAIGGALLAVAQAAQGVIGSHVLDMVQDPKFQPMAPLPVKYTPLLLR